MEPRLHSIPFEISLPKNEADFERMCAQVYGLAFSDPTPKMNGRRGQAQGGVDIFVTQLGVGRVGIQCKKYTAKPVKWTDVEAEVKEADDRKTPIKKLVIATTSRSDASLLAKVQALSDAREAKGLFPVEIEFWEDICNHIDRFPALQDSYAPNAPGAAFYRQDQAIRAVHETVFAVGDQVRGLALMPDARADSADRLINSQLDRTNDFLKAGQYSAAVEHIHSIGRDTTAFDTHQRARWHLQYGLCLWLIGGDDAAAATEMLKAYELFPNDAKTAAARVRALVILNRLDEANSAASEEATRFPTSDVVWLASAQARVSRGEAIAESQVPEFVRERADAMQLVAESQIRTGNVLEAVRTAAKALELGGSSFFVAHTALRVALEAAFSDVVQAHFGLLPERVIGLLEGAIARFEPLHEKLWAVQSSVVEQASYHLGVAHLLLGRHLQAVRIAEAARERGLLGAELLRVEVAARFELDDDEGISALAKSSLSSFTAEAMIVAAQSASRTANSSLAEDLLSAIGESTKHEQAVVDLVTAICIEALHRGAPSDTRPIERLRASGVLSREFVPALCVAAKVLDATGLAIDARALLDRIKALLSDESSVSDRMMVGELLFSLEDWADAASIYRQLTSAPGPSDLHDRLLTCYLRSGNRREAKRLLEGMADSWVERERTRELAIELGRQASDWDFLEPLLEAQTASNPERAANWLVKLAALLASGRASRFQTELNSVPEVVDGNPRSLSQLASLELRFGFAERGLRRLYRLARMSLDQPEAIAAFLVSVLAGPPKLPLLEDAVERIAAGTGLEVEDEHGRVHRVIIDPADVPGLPVRDGYLFPDSAEARALAGARVGDTVEIRTLSFGDRSLVKVKAIRSAYRQLLMVAQARAEQFGGLPHLKSVPVGSSGDPEQDLVHMKAEVRRSSAVTRDLLDRYAKGQLTLGGLAQLQGRGSYEAALGWPSEGPPMYVAQGTVQARVEAASRLSRDGSSFVIDSLTLAEFGRFDCLDALALLPRVLVATATRAVLEEAAREARDDRSIGSAIEVDGQMVFVEHDDAFKAHRIAFFQQLLDAVDRYCAVMPTYASLEEEERRYPGIASFLSHEEVEVLLLAKDSGSDVLSLDGRFREVCRLISSVEGVWPQAVVARCVGMGRLPEPVGSRFVVGQFLANRSFVSVSAGDLVWMVLQGGFVLQRGMQRLAKYVQSGEADFESSASVLMEFLERLAKSNVRLNAYAEVLRFVAEALARHRGRTEHLRARIASFVGDLVENANSQPPLHPMLAHARDVRAGFQKRVLMAAVEDAFSSALHPPKNRPLRIEVLFCSRLPLVVLAREGAADSLAGADAGPTPLAPKNSGSGDSSAQESGNGARPSAYLIAVPPEER